MTTYMEYRGNAFPDAMGDVQNSIDRKRSDGRLKSYTSCTDTRAWSIEDEQRRQFMLDLVKAAARKGQICPKYVPVQVIIDLLLASKSAEIDKLQKQLNEFKRLYNMVEDGDDIFQIKEAADSDYESTAEDFDVEDVDHDSEVSKQTILTKGLEIGCDKDVALQNAETLEEMKDIMAEQKRKLVHSQLKISSMGCEKSQQARVISSLQLLDLSALDEEMAMLSCGAGILTPEDETENIKKQLELLKRYYDKIAIMQDENIRLKKENAFYQSQLRKYADEESEIEVHTQMLEEELSRSFEQIRDLEDQLIVSRESVLESPEIQSLRQRSSMLDEVENERDYLAKRLDRLTGIEDQLIKIKARADEADMLEKENRRLLGELKELQKYKRVSDYQGKDIELLRSELRQSTISFETMTNERDKLKSKLSEMTGCAQALRQLEEEHSECSCVRAERDMLKGKMPDVEKLRKELNELKAEKDRKLMEEALDDQSDSIMQEENSFIIEIEMSTLIEVIDDLSLERDILKRRSGDLECIITDQEDEIKSLISQVEQLASSLGSGQEIIHDGLEKIRNEIEQKIPVMLSGSYNELLDKLTERDIRINELQGKLNEYFDPSKSDVYKRLQAEMTNLQQENSNLKQNVKRAAELCANDHIGKLLFECKRAVAIINRKVRMRFTQTGDLHESLADEENCVKLYEALQRANYEIDELQNKLEACEAYKTQQELLAENRQLRIKSDEVQCSAKTELEKMKTRISEVQSNNDVLKKDNERLQNMLKGIESDLKMVRDQLGGSMTCTCSDKNPKPAASPDLETHSYLRNLPKEFSSLIGNGPMMPAYDVYNSFANYQAAAAFAQPGYAAGFVNTGRTCTMYDVKRCTNEKLLLVKENVRLRSQITKIETEMRCLCDNVASLNATNNQLETKLNDLESRLNVQFESGFEECDLVEKLRSDIENIKCENACLRNCLVDVTGSESFLELAKKDSTAFAPQATIEGCELVSKLRSHLDDLKCENMCLRNCLADVTGSDSVLGIAEETQKPVEKKKSDKGEFVEKLQSDLEDLKCENDCLRNCLKAFTDSDAADAEENEKLKAEIAELRETIQCIRSCAAFAKEASDENPADLLKRTISKFESDIEGLTCENRCLRANLEIYTAEYEELVDELECTKLCKAAEVTIDSDELFRLKSINKALQSKLDKLTEELTSLKREKKQVETMQERELIDTSKYDAEIARLKNQITELQKTNNLLQSSLDGDKAITDYLERIRELESKVAQLEKLNYELNKQLADLEAMGSKLDQQKDTLPDSELENQLRELKRKLLELENINKAQSKQINELQAQVSQLEEEKVNLKHAIDQRDQALDADGRIASLKAECENKENSLREEIEKLKSKLRECEANADLVADVKKQSDLEEQIAKLKAQLKETEAFKGDQPGVENFLAKLRKECDDREADLLNEIAKLKSKLTDFENEEKDCNEREKDLLSQISKLKSLIQDLESGMADGSEKDLLAKLRKETEDRENDLLNEISKLKARIRELENGERAHNDRERELQDEISKLKSKIMELEIATSDDADRGSLLAKLQKERDSRENELLKEIDALKAQLRDLENSKREHSDKEKDFRDLIEKLNSRIKELESAKPETSEMDNVLAKLKKEKEDREAELLAEIAKLKAKIQDLEDKEKPRGNKEKELEDEISLLRSKLKELERGPKDITKDLEDEIAKLKAKIKELEDNEKKLHDHEKELQAEIGKLKAAVGDMQTVKESKSSLENQLSKLQKENENRERELQDEIAKLKSRLADIEKEKASCQEKEKQLQNELDQLRAKVKDMESGEQKQAEKAKDLQNEIENLKLKVKELEENLKKSHDKEMQQENEINNLKSKIKELEDELRKSRDKEKQLEDEMTNLKSKVKELEIEKENKKEVENKLDALNKEKEKIKNELQTEIDRLQKKITELENEKNKCNEKEKQLLGEISDLKTKLDDLLSEQKKKNQVEKELQDEISKLKSKIDELTNELKKANEKENASQDEITKLKAKIDDLTGELKKVNDKEKASQDEIAKLKTKIDELTSELKKVNDKEKASQDEIAKLKTKIDELTSELKKVNDKDKASQDEIAKLKAKVDELTSELKKTSDKEKSLQDEVSKLKSKIDNLTNELKEANEKDKASKDEISKLKSKIDDLTGELKKANEKDKASQDEIAKLKTKIDDLTNELKKANEKEKSLNDEISKLKSKIDDLTKELKEANDKDKASKDEIAKLKSKIEDLTNDLKKANEKEKASLDEIAKLKATISKLENESKLASQQNKDLNDEIEKLRKQIADLKDSKLSLESELAKVKKESNEKENELQNEIKKLNAQIKNLENVEVRKVELEKEVKDLQNQIVSLKNRISDLEDENKKLKMNNADIESRLALLTNEKNAQINKLQDEISKLKAQINNLENENKELEKQKSNLSNDVANLKKNLTDLENKYNMDTKAHKEKGEKEANDLRKEISELKAKLAKLEEENRDLKNQIDSLNKSKSDLERENSNLKQEAQNLNDKLSTLNKENADLKRERDTLKEKANNCEKEIENLNKKAKDSDEGTSKLKTELDNLKSKIKSLEDENESLKEQLKKCYEQNELTKSERDALEKEKNSLQKDLDDLLDKIQSETLGDDVLLQRERDEKNKLNDLIKQLQSQIKDLEANQKVVTGVVDEAEMLKLKAEIDRLNKLREKEKKDLERSCEDKLKKLKTKYDIETESSKKLQIESKISLDSSNKHIEDLEKLLAMAKADLEKCNRKIKELENTLESVNKDLENERRRSDELESSLTLAKPEEVEQKVDEIIRCPCGAPISSRLYITLSGDDCICGILEKATQTDPALSELPTVQPGLPKTTDLIKPSPKVSNSLMDILENALENGLDNLRFDEMLILHNKLKNTSAILNNNVNICGPPEETGRYLMMQHIAELERELVEKQKLAKEKLAALQVIIAAERQHLIEAKKALNAERNKYSDLVTKMDTKTREAASVQAERDLLRQQSLHREDLVQKLTAEIETYRKSIRSIEGQLAEERANVKYLKELLQKYPPKPGSLLAKAGNYPEPATNELQPKLKGEKDSKESIDKRPENNRISKSYGNNVQNDQEMRRSTGSNKTPLASLNKARRRAS